LTDAVPNLAVSVSHTTRPPRPGEADGINYVFVGEQEFRTMVEADEFLEYAIVFDHFYGTSRNAVERLLLQGKDVVLDIDWQGARAVKAKISRAVSVFILPPSRRELRRRLSGRGQDSPEVIDCRMRHAVSEMEHYGEFDHIVMNDDFDAAMQDLKAIIRGDMKSVRPMTIDIDALLGST
jgi:guanylate kinase